MRPWFIRTQERNNKLIIVQAVRWCFPANNATEGAIAIHLPSFRKWSVFVCLDDERGHRTVVSEVTSPEESSAWYDELYVTECAEVNGLPDSGTMMTRLAMHELGNMTAS